MLDDPLTRESDGRASLTPFAALAARPVADHPEPVAPQPVVTLANLDDYDPDVVLHCGYPSEEDGKPCGNRSRCFVQRMPNDYVGPHKFVHVCMYHAKRWRKAIPYCYIVEIGTGRVFPGQRCETPYEKTYEQPDGADLDTVRHG